MARDWLTVTLPVRHVQAEDCQVNWEFVEAFFFSGVGDPEGRIKAGVGALFLRHDGGAGTTLYVKESGTDVTGWVAK